MNAWAKKGLILLISLMIVVNLAGCSERQYESTETNNVFNVSQTVGSEETEEVFVREEIYPFSGGCTVSAVVRIADTLLIQGYNNEKAIFSLAKYHVDDSGYVKVHDYTELRIDESDDTCEPMVLDITAGGDNNFYIMTSERPKEHSSEEEIQTSPAYQGRMTILCYNTEGFFLGKLVFDQWEQKSIFGILVDAEQYVTIYGQTYIASFSWDDPNNISMLNIDENSCIMTGALWKNNILFSISGAESAYYSYNAKSREISPALIYDSKGLRPSYIDGSSKCQGLNGELILNELLQFWECKSPENCQPIFRWNYTINFEYLPYVCRVSEKAFICTSLEEEYLSVLCYVEQAKTDRTIVDVAFVNVTANNTVSALLERNNSAGSYEYVITEYNGDEVTRLLTDINAGNSPDLIIFDKGLYLSPEKFEDLYTYIDKDPDISKEDFIPNYLESMAVNNKLYEIWPSVKINTIVARASDVNDNKALRPADYEQIVENNEKYNATFGAFMTKENLLRWVSVVGISSYIDKNTGTCCFTDPSFAELLNWCAEQGVESSMATPEALDKDETLLNIEIISSPERVKAIKENLGEPFTFVGFPVLDHGENFYSCGQNGAIAIPRAAQNKSGAWDFVKSMLVLNTQLEVKNALPVNMVAFERKAEATLNPDEVKLLLTLVSDTKFAENTADSALREIIISSGQAFLNGDKSLEETISIIQSRASIYMSEHYG